MIRVGFIIRGSDKWIAGLNYYRNLFSAISSLHNKEIQIVLFFSSNESEETLNMFKEYGEVVKSPVLSNKKFVGLLNSILLRLFNRSFLLLNLFKENNIDVVSHSSFITGYKKIKTINWIVDFQHIHYPEMFSLLERFYRNILFWRIAKYSNAVVLSSNNTLIDFREKYPRYLNKTHVLSFIAQIDPDVYKTKDVKDLEKRYGFSGKFFFLPNQLWKHKNHMIVAQALKILKDGKRGALVLCTGYMNDYRNGGYIKFLSEYIKESKLEMNMRFLGFVDRKDVQRLMRFSVAILNPSLFEGWSTTVEEAKSLGKNMILSDLNVHREQNPPESVFFNPHKPKELAQILWKKWVSSRGGPDYDLEKEAKKVLRRRVRRFAESYQEIVTKL